MPDNRTKPILGILFVALSMFVGWGIRGVYGHEYGAMIPGALVGLGICLISGREDWYRRYPFFGLFGALGWAFGGAMSYGILIGYTFSGDLVSVSYGFAALFLVGALWGGVGAGILGLAAELDRERLTSLIVPVIIVALIWLIQDGVVSRFFGEAEPDALDYYDVDWLDAATVLVALTIMALVQKRVTYAVSLGYHLAIGWVLGMLSLVTLLGLHLSPPRSDNWAGSLGLFLGLLVFLYRQDHIRLMYVSLFVAIFGGIGFSTGELFQATLNALGRPGLDYWKVMEEVFGLIMGLGVALAFLRLRDWAPRKDDADGARPWAEGFAVFFILLVITYVNFHQNIQHWFSSKILPDTVSNLSAELWFGAVYLMVAAAVLTGILRHRRWPLAFLPEGAAGRASLLYLLFFWWVVAGTLWNSGGLRPTLGAILVEGSFVLGAVLCTIWVIRNVPVAEHTPSEAGEGLPGGAMKRVAGGILLALVAAVVIQSSIALGTHPEGRRGHIRFGEQADTPLR